MKNFVQMFEDNQMVKVFHVTPSRSVKGIQRKGLIPKIGPRSRLIKEKVPTIYVFPDIESLENGVSNWLGDAFDEETKLSILELTVPSAWVVREELQWEVKIMQTIPPENIRVMVPDVDEWAGGMS
jgi:hypothetical protein